MKKSFLVGLVCLMGFFASAQVKSKGQDHQMWNTLLTKHVGRNGLVNYEGFRSDIKNFNAYLDQLRSNPPAADWPKKEAMAYWINAYNAFTIRLILDNYPISSIMKINEGKAWDLAFIRIGKKSYSLNNIEHDILRKNFADPRIHFAVNCASFSCPRLNFIAFTAKNLETELDKMASSFINNPAKNDLKNPSDIKISQLFDWYKVDFTKKGTLIEFINKYSKVQIKPDAKIGFMEYNWKLNN